MQAQQDKNRPQSADKRSEPKPQTPRTRVSLPFIPEEVSDEPDTEVARTVPNPGAGITTAALERTESELARRDLEVEDAIAALATAATQQVTASPDPRIKPPSPNTASQGSMPRSASPLSTFLDNLATVDPRRSRRASSEMVLPPGPAADATGDRPPREHVGPDKWRDSPLFGASPEPSVVGEQPGA